MARLPTAKLRAAKMSSGIIGFGALRSHNGNAIRQATPTTRLVSDRRMGQAQSLLLDEGVHGTGQPDRVQHRAHDVDLGPPLGTELVVRQLGGQVQRDGQRHDVDSEDPPPAQRIDQDTPRAAGRRRKPFRSTRSRCRSPRACSAPENLALIIASELGTRNAAPTPCRQRAATSTQPLGANAHNSEETAKMTSPIRSTAEPAEGVGDRTCDEDERTEGEQVAVHHPLLQR